MAGLGRTPVAELALTLRDGAASAEDLAEAATAAIRDSRGEGARAFVEVDEDKILAQARASDLLRAHGIAPSVLAGIPVSVKDLFDVAGEVTRAGSLVRGDEPPASMDAPAIARLRAAGAVLAGRTNMTEFAYSGVGINPHYGTPANPWDRETGRIPGGSSSGAAVSVTDAMAGLAIGTDTGGSCRIPAALCGIVGIKPTAARIPLEGCYPLASSLDSIGALGPTVSCVALAVAIMAGEAPEAPSPVQPSRLRLAVPRNFVFDGVEDEVARSFESALSRLSAAGVSILAVELPAFATIPDFAAGGGIAGAEAFALHGDLLSTAGERYDPRVRSRIELARNISLGDYKALLRRREALIAEIDRETVGFDALAMPTVPIVAPPFADFEDDENFVALNRLLLRNPSIFNLVDGCAISLPCHRSGEAPVGFMLGAPRGRDGELTRVAASVEAVLAHSTGGNSTVE